LARATVELACRTDAVTRQAEALLALAEVLELGGAVEEAKEHVAVALDLYERKGNTAGTARVRAKHGEPRAGLSVRELRPT
jgi:hypothetical protein